MKKNCWEVKKCGLEPEGVNVDQFGVCPVTVSNDFNEINNGKYGGRFCWAIAGTFCDEEVQGSYAQKLESCIYCAFFKLVQDEEERNFTLSPIKIKAKK